MCKEQADQDDNQRCHRPRKGRAGVVVRVANDRAMRAKDQNDAKANSDDKVQSDHPSAIEIEQVPKGLGDSRHHNRVNYGSDKKQSDNPCL